MRVKMNDFYIYYDFSKEIILQDWNIAELSTGKYLLSTQFDADAEAAILAFQLRPQDAPAYCCILAFELNGKNMRWNQNAPALYHPVAGCTRQGMEIALNPGSNSLKIELESKDSDSLKNFAVQILPALSKVEKTLPFSKELEIPEEKITETAPLSWNTDGFQPGAIRESGRPGRFGFSKGDGTLDSAMPVLGIVNKMYPSGHPKYRKAFFWNYSLLPENASFHGSFPPANTSVDGDDIQINQLSVHWKAKFGKINFACTYSLGTPGIITESDEGKIRLSNLEQTGNYQYALYAGPGHKIQIVTLDRIDLSRMSEGFLMLFGTTEFPDIPLFLVFTQKPSGVMPRYNKRNNRLKEIVFEGCSTLITATPFGIESFEPLAPDRDDFIRKAVRLCRFWNRALLAYPVSCEEYYKLDFERQTDTVIQKFTYRYFQDEWNTEPLELAPVPPVSTLAGISGRQDLTDFEFPTKFGWLRGKFGNVSSYVIPFMQTDRKFPLEDRRHPEIRKMLNQGMQEYFDFEAHFPDSMQAYPYAGALMEPYAWAGTMLNFMNDEYQEKLRSLCEERLKGACDPEKTYDYPVINFSEFMQIMPDDRKALEMYADPAMRHMKLWNWYHRTEPFTKAGYMICYLNVWLFFQGYIKTGKPEEVAALKISLIENDWGAGLTFYYMYQCALVSGNWDPIRQNWSLLQEVYAFFELMQDWACMGTGYSDNALLWCEGANYGIFTSFVNMARAIGDTQTLQRAIHSAAKQQVLRMAIIRSSQHYFYRFFGVEPWYSSRLFCEECFPNHQFLCYPSNDIFEDRCRPEGIYNMTTEGLYPEMLDSLRHLVPDDGKEIFRRYENLLKNHPERLSQGWGNVQHTCSMLIAQAMDPEVTDEQLMENISLAEKRHLFMTRWRGIHIFSRRLPEHYFKAQLLAWQTMKQHPLWLESWYDLTVIHAEWDGEKAIINIRITGKAPVLRCGFRKKPKNVLRTNRQIKVLAEKEYRQLLLFPDSDGTYDFYFD